MELAGCAGPRDDKRAEAGKVDSRLRRVHQLGGRQKGKMGEVAATGVDTLALELGLCAMPSGLLDNRPKCLAPLATSLCYYRVVQRSARPGTLPSRSRRQRRSHSKRGSKAHTNFRQLNNRGRGGGQGTEGIGTKSTSKTIVFFAGYMQPLNDM